MFIRVVPAGVLELLLFLVIVGSFWFVVRRVLRRPSFLPSLDGVIDLPALTTDGRVSVVPLRVFRDRSQDGVMVKAKAGDRTVAFCAVDFATNAARYEASLNTTVEIALYALSTLEPTVDMDCPTFASGPGRYPNEYWVSGRVHSRRFGTFDGGDVTIYRLDTAPPKAPMPVFEFAVDRTPGDSPFAEGALVQGPARLFGYLPQ